MRNPQGDCRGDEFPDIPESNGRRNGQAVNRQGDESDQPSPVIALAYQGDETDEVFPVISLAYLGDNSEQSPEVHAPMAYQGDETDDVQIAIEFITTEEVESALV